MPVITHELLSFKSTLVMNLGVKEYTGKAGIFKLAGIQKGGRCHDILVLQYHDWSGWFLAFWVDPRDSFECLGRNATPQFDTSIDHGQLTSIAPSQP